MAQQGAADEGEVTDEVEGFVAAGLVGEAQAPGIADAIGGEADGRIEGDARHLCARHRPGAHLWL